MKNSFIGGQEDRLGYNREHLPVEQGKRYKV